MKCMKCGTTIPSGQVFCDNCLENMAKHPVKPGTPIQLPNRATSPAAKPSHKRAKKVHKPEEQVVLLRRTVIILSLLVVALVAALSFAIAELFR